MQNEYDQMLFVKLALMEENMTVQGLLVQNSKFQEENFMLERVRIIIDHNNTTRFIY